MFVKFKSNKYDSMHNKMTIPYSTEFKINNESDNIIACIFFWKHERIQLSN